MGYLLYLLSVFVLYISGVFPTGSVPAFIFDYIKTHYHADIAINKYISYELRRRSQ